MEKEDFVFTGSARNLPEWIQKLIDRDDAYLADYGDEYLGIIDEQGEFHHFKEGDTVPFSFAR